MPAELRTQAYQATGMLKPYGKSIVQAAQFYKAYLHDLQKRQDSATIAKVAGLWYEDKESGKTKTLRAEQS